MKKIICLFFILLFQFTLFSVPWSEDYQNLLMERVGGKIKDLSTYPSLRFPNIEDQKILNKYPDGKVLIFGYGSLMNMQSASRSVSPESLQSMRPVVSFGLKRIFNYKAHDVSRWGKGLPDLEKAMLNVEPMTTYRHIVNGIVMEVSPQDLAKLINREKGYDLVPVLVADWNDVISQNPDVKIEVAYTFYVPDELRNGVNYSQTKYYPVRGYLNAVREGASIFGEQFLNYWNLTTYLGNGTTTVNDWDEETFTGILDTKEP